MPNDNESKQKEAEMRLASLNERFERQYHSFNALQRHFDSLRNIGQEQCNIMVLNNRMQMVKDLWEQCGIVHLQLCRMKTPEDETRSYFAKNQFEVAESIFFTFNDEVMTRLHQVAAQNTPMVGATEQPPTPNPRRRHDLPKIALPTFAGTYTQWNSFRDYFSSLVINDASLDDLQRLHYLNSCVEGEAKSLIQNIALTGNNFTTAWECLTDQFENPRAMVNSYLKALFSLPVIIPESAESLKTVRNKSYEIVSALETLGRFTSVIKPSEDKTKSNGVSDILVYHIVQKLDTNTRLAWELNLGSSREFPRFEQLIKFLDTRIRALEALPEKGDSTKPKPSQVRSHVAQNSGDQCPLCSSAHRLFACAEFKKQPVNMRFQFVKEKRLCLNCFGAGHSAQSCYNVNTCARCQLRHHTLLHFDKHGSKSSEIQSEQASAPEEAANSIETIQSLHASSAAVEPARILLATAQIVVTSNSNRAVKVRALLDQGSTWTFITEELANALQVRPSKAGHQLIGLGNVAAGTASTSAPISIRAKTGNGPAFHANALVLKRLTNYLPSITANSLACNHLQGLEFADNDLSGSSPIHVIIGADLYGTLLREGLRKGQRNEPVAQNSALGWILSGNNAASQDGVTHSEFVHHCVTNEELQKSIEQFWVVESTVATAPFTLEEEECEDHFKKTHSRTSDGRYIVRLPFKSKSPIDIGSSRVTAERSMSSLSSRLLKSPEIRRMYQEFMEDYESRGHMTRVEANRNQNNRIVYLPHHPVVRESSSTTKLRVVFNASARTSNCTSLNQHMHVGPKLQVDLIEVLLQWRTFRFVYCADIAKMYRQILVAEADRDYQRVLWTPSLDGHPFDYQLNTVTYGTAAAPYLALRVLRQLVEDEGASFPRAIPVLNQHIYVDDCLFGADTESDAIRIRDELCALLEKGRFTLRKWASNSVMLMSDIDPHDHGLAIEKPVGDDDSIKILGVGWMPATDNYKFSINIPDSPTITKRSVLSLIARLYDPLGWVSPVIIVAKMLMQRLWMLSLAWDDPLPVEVANAWQTFRDKLPCLENVMIPRWTGQGSDVQESSLHGFSDASNAAYAAVVYLRLVLYSGEIRVILIMSRTKVAPLKQLSIPRLELCGAVLLAKLVSFIRNLPQFSKLDASYWTDSTIVLAWLSKHASSWKTFVANRISAIQSTALRESWRHVPTKDNPADLASRGIEASVMASHFLWWHGPPWLSQLEHTWPVQRTDVHESLDVEARVPTHHVQVKPNTFMDDLGSRISSLPRLIRVLAYVLQMSPRHRQEAKLDDDLSLTWFCIKARGVVMRHIQSAVFPDELKCLRSKSTLSPESPVLSLNPVLDDQGIMRVGGRLANASIDELTKHPIILQTHPLVGLLIRYTHEKCLHGGTQLTLASLRQEFWVLRARQTVKSVIHKCVTCARIKSSIATQLMAPLPPPRVVRSARPFDHSGLDYAGPLNVRLHQGRGYKSHPAYIAVFVCLTVRAIHLELVSDYTSDAFLAAFKRFIARRGLPSTMYSDNGTTFKGANRELVGAFTAATQNPTFRAYLANDRISWKFIPPAAPHFGGIWEAGVRSVKHHLRRMIGAHTPTFEQLTTVLCQIEACLNSRPLEPLSDDPEDLRALTPGHFLIGSELTASPEPSLLEVAPNRLSHWQLWQQIVESFWRHWSSDYLLSLQHRTKWRLQQDPIRVGQMVLLRDENLPPTKWQLGRVIEVHPGPDNLIRVVTVRTANATYKRPIAKLALLPVQSEANDDQSQVTSPARENK